MGQAVRDRRRATILDVAARAGVHAGTVSRALSDPDRVAAPTRARIAEAVAALGFVPNRAARGLITGRTGNLAVIVPDITNPYFSSLVRAVQRAARSADLQVLLVDTGEQRDEEVRAARSLAPAVDGFIVVSPRRLHRELDVLGDRRAVFVNRPLPDRASVLLRAAPAVRDALAHLAALGHRRVAHLGGPRGSWSASERRTALRRSATSIGVDIVELPTPAPTFDAARDAVPAIERSQVSAVLAFNDVMALGVMAGLAERGRAVPGDMSVVGCDDVPMAAMVAPALSTIALPTADAGTAAVELFAAGAGTRELFGSFVTRSSTAAPRPGGRWL